MYGPFLALGVGLGAAVMWWLAPRLSFRRETAIDLAFWGVIGGIIGARALQVAIEWEFYRDLCMDPARVLPQGVPCASDADCFVGQACDGIWCRPVADCLAAFKYWKGGWTFLGGVLGGIVSSWLTIRYKKLAPAAAYALLAVALPLGHAFGRVGCWSKGCCFGAYSDGALAVGGRFPTQLWEVGADIVIFGLLVWRFVRVTSPGGTKAAGPGGGLWSVPALYVALYAPVRFVIEIFRGDDDRGFLFRVKLPALADALGLPPENPLFLSTSQTICLLLLAAAGVWWMRAVRSASSSGVPFGGLRAG